MFWVPLTLPMPARLPVPSLFITVPARRGPVNVEPVVTGLPLGLGDCPGWMSLMTVAIRLFLSCYYEVGKLPKMLRQL